MLHVKQAGKNKTIHLKKLQLGWASPKHCSIFKMFWLKSLYISHHEMVGWRMRNKLHENYGYNHLNGERSDKQKS